MLNHDAASCSRHRRRVRRAPAPASCGALGLARAIANRTFAQTVVFETNGHGNGHRAGTATEHIAVGPVGDRRGGRTGQPGAAGARRQPRTMAPG